MDYTAEDEVIIAKMWDDLQLSCQKICKSDEDWDFIRRAMFLAKEAHKGVRRRSGEPYLLHPIAVAKIAVDEIGLGVKAVVASLLHDVVEDTDYTVEDMERIFGAKIASMVDGLTKMSGVFNTDASEQAEYFRKVLLTLSDDVRVILIKIADRLHNMRTLGSMPQNKQIKITSETFYLFAPLAHRLGLYAIKTELEDLCMKYRFPVQYESILKKLSETEGSRQEYIAKFTAPIIDALDRYGFDYKIEGRVKSVYSIWSKMQRKQIAFEEIYDLFAVRVIFLSSPFPSEKTQCWQIYSSITDIYTPKPDRLRDWISVPKDNGYEALHSTVMGPDGVWVEVQIRTQRMDDIAERGFAAHWKYKKEAITRDDTEFDNWLRKIRDALSSPTDSAIDFLDNFKLSLYTSEILVFTPKGESRSMPYGSTALDFAYDIHTKIGNSAIAAKINHKIQPISTPINSGDQIEIVTSENVRPQSEWLNFVSTSKAVQAVNSFLKREHQNNIERGMMLFEQELTRLNIPLAAGLLRKILPAYDSTNKDEFYSKVGAEIIKLDQLGRIIKATSRNKVSKFWSLFISNKSDNKSEERAHSGDVATSEKSSDAEFVIAECCKPIPGDVVVGYKDPVSNTIHVHKSTCDELTRLGAQFGRNIIKDEIKWSQHKRMSYLSSVSVRGIDRIGLMLDLTKVVTADFNTNMSEVNIKSNDGVFEGSISLYIKNADALHVLMDKMLQIEGIVSVKRIN